mgnify:CR=1 FL=1
MVFACGLIAALVALSPNLQEHFNVKNVIYKLNSLLPKDIVVLNILKVIDDAHARFNAESRSYQYRINFGKDPFLTDTTWQINQIDISEYMHDTIQLAFVHNNSTNQFALKIDSVGLKSYNHIVSYSIHTANNENGPYQLLETINALDFESEGTYINTVSHESEVWVKITPTYADGGESPHNNPIRFTNTVNIRTIENNRVKIYPNPAKDILFVETENIRGKENCEISIFNANGIKISTHTCFQKAQISVKDLYPGIYYVRIALTERTLNQKLIIQ